MIYPKVFEAKPNEYYNIEHYDYVIRDNQEGYTIGDNEEIKPLFYLIKGGIKNPDKYKEIINKLGKSKTKNRGSASGVCDIKQFPKGAVKLVCPKTHKELEEGHKYVSVKYEDSKGKVCSRCQSNIKRSACAGYFDNVGALPCRAVGWTQKNPDKQKVLVELAEDIDAVFKETNKEYYEKQKKLADMKPQFRLGETIFSTQTINYDFRTACHKDKGDFKEGLSTLTIFEEIPNNYYGFYLGLPEYKICFDLRDGDILIFDAHEYHCNTEYLVQSDKLPKDDLTGEPFAGRCGVVSYLRNRLWKCPENIKYIIPTFNRPEILKERTLKVLNDNNINKKDIYIFYANQEEKEKYNLDYPNQIIGVKGLVLQRNFMIDYFEEGQKLLWLDDDISDIKKVITDIEAVKENKPFTNKFDKVSLKEITDKGFKHLKKEKLSLFGLYPVNNKGFMKVDNITDNLKYIVGAFFGTINKKYHKAIVPEENYHGSKEDLLRSIKVYKKEGGVIRLNQYTAITKYWSNKGGLQNLEDLPPREERERLSVEYITKKYPDYCSSYIKKNGIHDIRLKRLNRTCVT